MCIENWFGCKNGTQQSIQLPHTQHTYVYNLHNIDQSETTSSNHDERAHIFVWNEQQEQFDIAVFPYLYTMNNRHAVRYRSITNETNEHKTRTKKVFHFNGFSSKWIRKNTNEGNIYPIPLLCWIPLCGLCAFLLLCVCVVWICIENALAHNACAHALCQRWHSTNH